MKSFYTVLLLECRRIFAKRNFVIVLLYLLLSLYFVQSGIYKYKNIVISEKKFQEVENIKIQNYVNYNQYGAYGFRLLFVPSPLSLYYVNSSLITELTANIDSADILKIYNSLKGSTLFSEKSGGFKDFSGIFFLFGTLLALFFGFETFLHKDFMRFLCGTIPLAKLFFSIIVIRLMLLALFMVFTLTCSLILVKVNDLALNRIEYRFLLVQFTIMVMLQFFFFAAGLIAGTLKSRFAGFLMVVIMWFTLIFLFPGVIWSVIASKAENITPTYNLELQKLKVVMGFERNALETVGRFSAENAQTDEGRKLILEFWDKEYSKIKRLEKKLEREMINNIRTFFRFSLWFPTSFYLASSNEISSKGYKSYIEFFDYIQNLKENFIRFCIEKRIIENYAKVESFVKKDENIFYARNMLPDYFRSGMMLMTVYVFFLLLFAYHSLRKSLVI